MTQHPGSQPGPTLSVAGIQSLRARLAAFPAGLAALTSPLPAADLRWKPSPSGWSICEVLWHLADEESLDFIVRLRLTIESPGEPWPPIDPEGLAILRSYNDLDPHQALERFATARAANLQWAQSLTPQDLTKAYPHPRFGPVPASILFASWSAHDALHLRQIAKRLHQLVARDAPGVRTDYAGEW